MSITKQIELNKEKFLEALIYIEHHYNSQKEIEFFERNFNHIYRRISVLFGTEDCQKYIEDISISNIDERKVFPDSVWLLIKRIKIENDKLLPPKKEQIEFTFA